MMLGNSFARYKFLGHLQYIFILLVFIIAFVNIKERNETINDYLEYLTVVPAKVNYLEGEDFSFLSFAISYKRADTRWTENVWCANQADGVFQAIPFVFNSEAESYLSNNRYPSHILEILEKQDYNSLETESKLRLYATTNSVKGWTLNINKPALNSVCLTKHTITIKTTFFNFERYTTIVSTPFTYGAK